MAINVSIIIPTKDRPEMLKRAVASALKSASLADEVIVVDDGSHVPAQDISGSFGDPRLVVIPSYGRGAAAARNTGIGAATGEMVFFLDDDDQFLPDYIAYVMDIVLAVSPRPDFGYSGIITEALRKGKVARRTRLPRIHGLYGSPRQFESRMHGFGMGFWAKRSVFAEVGAIAENLTTNEDTEFFLRLTRSEFTGWFAPRPGVVVHRHHGETGELSNLTDRASNETRLQSCLDIAAKHDDLLTDMAKIKRFLERKGVRLAAKSHDLGKARAHLGRLGVFCEASFWIHGLGYKLKQRKSP